MERNKPVSTPSLSTWENLAVHSYSSSNHNKSTEPVTKQKGYSYSTSMPSSSDPMMTSLRLGRRKEYGDDHDHNSCFPGISMSTYPSIPVGPAKRSRASYQNMLNPCCQVEGCNLDLKSAKDYHRRHRICEIHSKSPRVIVAGMECRFCQQCSRFHNLSEFDDKKRSCRRRLLDHNARRRRVQPESVQLLSARLSSASYDQRQHMNSLLNGLPVPLSNSTWEDANTNYMLRQGLVMSSRTGVLDGSRCYSSDEIRKSTFELRMDLDKLPPIHSSNHQVLDQCLQIPTVNSSTAPYLLNAHSLLSSNSWSLNEGQSTSMEGGLVHGNYNNHHHHNNNNQHLHEYQLFKEADNGFCSPQRNV